MLGSVRLGSVHVLFHDSFALDLLLLFSLDRGDSFFFPLRSMKYITKFDQIQLNSFDVTTLLMVVGRLSCHMRIPRRTSLLAYFVYGSVLMKVHFDRSLLRRMEMKEVVVSCVNCMYMGQQSLFTGEIPPNFSTKYVLFAPTLQTSKLIAIGTGVWHAVNGRSRTDSQGGAWEHQIGGYFW